MTDCQCFLKQLNSKPWNAGDRLRANLDAAVHKLGYMVDRVLRAFTDDDTARIVSTFHARKRDKDAYEDIPGFCKSATLDEISEHGCVLTPGRYVGAEEVEDDGIPFADKMATLTSELADQVTESAKLEKAIRKNMEALGFALPKASAE